MSLTPSADAERRVGGGRERAAAVLGRDDVVGVDLLLDGRLRRGAQAGAERGDDGDQREADHQRGGRRGRAPGVADRVLAGEPAGRAAEAGGREADQRGERLHQARSEHGDADEQREHADAERQRDESAADAAEQADRRARPARGRRRRCRGVRACGPGRPTVVAVEPSRTAEIGGTRVARSAGTMLATSVTIVPVSMLTMIVRVASTVPDFGRSTPIAANSALMPLAMPSPSRSPMHRREQADDRALRARPSA